MNETTDSQCIIAFVCVMVIIATASFVVHRIQRARKIHYNDFLLRRRDNFPMGDLDVD